MGKMILTRVISVHSKLDFMQTTVTEASQALDGLMAV